MKKIRICILNVPFDKMSLSETVQLFDQACSKKKKMFCVTPNPEICLAAQKDKSFLKILKSAQLSIPDGFGILWAARYLSGKTSIMRWLITLLTPQITRKHSPFIERVTGTDVMKNFCKEYPTRRIFLLGASPEVNEKLSMKLKKDGVRVVGNFSGDASDKLAPIICSIVNTSKAQVIFVAFGAPKQERWIVNNLKHLKTVRVAIGIGGAFDFLVGKRKRAPKWMRKVGLEWLYRLMIEPKRLKRIFMATVVFPVKVLVNSWKK